MVTLLHGIYKLKIQTHEKARYNFRLLKKCFASCYMKLCTSYLQLLQNRGVAEETVEM